PQTTTPTVVPVSRRATRGVTKHRVVICAISPRFMREAESELDKRPGGPLQQLYGTNDAVLRDLMFQLAGEAEAGGPFGTVYAESLSTALATRLLFAARSLQAPSHGPAAALPRRVLLPVLEGMAGELDVTVTVPSL